ncbi:MAG: molybdenum ABC transporter ATP-binding protein [Ignavibacteria bacterium]
MSIRARFRLSFAGFGLDVDLELPSRGVTGLYGPSGSGKTTLLRCIAGLERSALGQLTVDRQTWQGDGVFLPTHQRPIGYVFQDARLFPHLAVRRNLDFGRRRVAAPDQRVAQDHAVELLGIGHLLDRLPDTLSGGERQRVAIARALLTSPRLLLMDEPMAALDVGRKREILPYLERLHDELEIPVLYVSHSPDEVARLADHIVVMEAGRAVAQGPLSETLARLDLPVRFGEDAGVVLAGRIGERDDNWHLARVEFDGGSLWVRDGGQGVGQRVRVRILARDVSIALEPDHDSSILNTLPATVAEIADESHPAIALVKLQVGGAAIVARLTRRSVCGLELAPGRQVFVQIKAVALI